MFEVGNKVYAWSNGDFCLDSETKEPIIGTITEVSHDACRIQSVITEDSYFVAKWKLYPIGDGPVMDHGNKTYEYEDLFQDQGDDVLFNIPPVMIAQLGCEPGDTFEISENNGSLVLKLVKEEE